MSTRCSPVDKLYKFTVNCVRPKITDMSGWSFLAIIYPDTVRRQSRPFSHRRIVIKICLPKSGICGQEFDWIRTVFILFLVGWLWKCRTTRSYSNRAVRGTPDQKDHFGDKWKSCQLLSPIFKNVYWRFCFTAKSQ